MDYEVSSEVEQDRILYSSGSAVIAIHDRDEDFAIKAVYLVISDITIHMADEMAKVNKPQMEGGRYYFDTWAGVALSRGLLRLIKWEEV